MPKRSATAPRCFRPPPSSAPASRWSIVEGEFDALLLAQALGDLAAVVTLGSASARPEGSTYLAMLPAPRGTWRPMPTPLGTRPPKGGRPVRFASSPPRERIGPRAAQAGVDLRQWWTDRLGGIEAAPPDPAPWKVSPSETSSELRNHPRGPRTPPTRRPGRPVPRNWKLAHWLARTLGRRG